MPDSCLPFHSLLLLFIGGNKLQYAARPASDRCLQRQVTAIGKHQFIKLDLNLAIRREIGV